MEMMNKLFPHDFPRKGEIYKFNFNPTRGKEIRSEAKFISTGKKAVCLHSTIASLQVDKEKITAFLTDKREISIPTAWLTDKPVSLDQLQNYQL
jgi:hypothetical protein